jgi:hypothetical protein
MEREDSFPIPCDLSHTLQTTRPLSHFLRAQREWESRPPKSPSAEIHLHKCAGDIRFLGSVLATAPAIRSTQRCFVYILSFVVFPERRLLLFVFRRSFERLQGIHLPPSTLYNYIKHTHEMSRGSGATDDLSIGPPQSTLCFFFVFLHVLLLFTVYASSYTHMHIYVIT